MIRGLATLPIGAPDWASSPSGGTGAMHSMPELQRPWRACDPRAAYQVITPLLSVGSIDFGGVG